MSVALIYINSIAQNSSKLDEQSGLYGIVDVDGNYIIKPKFKEVDFNFGIKQGLSYVIDKNDKYGLINEEGKEVVACKYDKISSFENGVAIVKIKSGGEFDFKHGLIDSTGKEVIPVKWGRMEYYPFDRLLVVGEESASKLGVIDETGKVIIPFQYAFWSKRISKGLWPVGRNDSCGVVNMKNEIVVPFIYYMIESYSDKLGLAPAKKDGKWGYINREGLAVIPFIYNDAWGGDYYLPVKKDGKWGVIDVDNKIIIPIEYISIESVFEKSARVTKSETEGSIEIDLITLKKISK